jgi:hypothetical protein
MDEQATFSVTVTSIAQLRDEHILIGRHGLPLNIKIIDGMAGATVGGDSFSFMLHFPQGLVTLVIKEHDPFRFRCPGLHHNMNLVRLQLGHFASWSRRRAALSHGQILDLWKGRRPRRVPWGF